MYQLCMGQRAVEEPQSLRKRIQVGGHYQWLPKGLIQSLKAEVATRAQCSWRILQKEITPHPDLKNANNILECLINSHGLAFLFNPKYPL